MCRRVVSHPLRLRAALLGLAATLAAGCSPAAASVNASPARTPTAPASADVGAIQLLEWMATHRQQVSLLAHTRDARHGAGAPVDATDTLAVGERTGRFLASTAKILILAAYAREVAAGRMDAEELVARRLLDAWWLPNDDGAHDTAMQALGVPALGMLRLDDVAQAMIVFSDNAAADYLLARLGPQAIAATAAQAGMTGQRLPLRRSLAPTLALADRELGATPLQRARALAALPAAQRDQLERRLESAYFHDPGRWRRLLERETTTLGSDRAGLQAQLELAPLVCDWTGTASDYARLVQGAANGTLINPRTAQLVSAHLEAWARRGDSSLAAAFATLGGKDGMIPGVRTIAAFAVPRQGAYAGHTRVVVILINGMDADAFLALVQSNAFERLAAAMASDPELVAFARQRLAGPDRAGPRPRPASAQRPSVGPPALDGPPPERQPTRGGSTGEW